MPKLERSEWYDLCRDMNWRFKYVTDAEVFPEALSQSHGIPAAAWWNWDEPYKISYRDYVHNQAEKDASGGVLVAVQDSGPGLSPKSFDRVFDAFYTTKPGGVGMGLSICRSIIEAHGGRLWASANDPRGATFQFTVPTVEASSPQFTTTS